MGVAEITDSWQGNDAENGDFDGTIQVTIILQTSIQAPFEIVEPRVSFDYNDGASAVADLGLTSVVDDGGVNCNGPYTDSATYDGSSGARALVGAVNSTICTQRWGIQVPMDLAAGQCELSNAKLTFYNKADQAGTGFVCGPNDDGLFGALCPAL